MDKFNFETRLKAGYVTFARVVASAANSVGICKFLNARRDQRWAHWLQSLGAIHSIDQMIDLDVPWWTYDAIDEVDQFLQDHKNARVLEYGSGASTIWLAKRAGTVISIEHHEDWYSMLTKKTDKLSNVEVSLKPPTSLEAGVESLSKKAGNSELDFTNYVNAIDQFHERFDLIIIDGRARAACLQAATGHLEEGGIIVFDNSKRQRYTESIVSCGGKVRRFSGLTPSLPYFDETTLITFPAGRI